jgi:hypothetical protein
MPSTACELGDGVPAPSPAVLLDRAGVADQCTPSSANQAGLDVSAQVVPRAHSERRFTGTP